MSIPKANVSFLCAAFLFWLGFSAGCGNDSDRSNSEEDSEEDAGDDSEDAGEDDELDCSQFPSGPFDLVLVEGAIADDDLVFDTSGHLIGYDDENDVLLRMKYGAAPEEYSEAPAKELALLPNGDIGFSGIDYPYALGGISADGSYYGFGSAAFDSISDMAVHPSGWVFTSLTDTCQIYRADLSSDEVLFDNTSVIGIADIGLYGLSFNAEYDRLFVTTYTRLYYVDIDAQGNWAGTLTEWSEIDYGNYKHFELDACNNLYFLFENALHRISADGQKDDVLLDLPGQLDPRADMEWGSGIDGWSRTSIFFTNSGDPEVYQIDVGIPGKPTVVELAEDF